MTKKKSKKWILIVVLILVVIINQGEKQMKKLAGETMEREFSTDTIQLGDTFTIKYKVLNYGADPFFFSISDTITGGCTVFGDTQIITTLTSPATETGAITVTAPTTMPASGKCTFSGDWKLGSDPIVNFLDMDVSIQSGCSDDMDCDTWDTVCQEGKCNIETGECYAQNLVDGTSCPGGKCLDGICELTTSMERELSIDNVEPSETFTVIYKVLDPQPPFFFSISDTITGGCTVFGDTQIITTLTSPATETGAITVTAPTTMPASGKCTFSGDWKLGSYSEVNFLDAEVTISSIGCTQDSECIDLDDECNEGKCGVDNTCYTEPKTDGTSCSGGTCQGGICKSIETCAELTGTICIAGQTCDGGQMTSTSDTSYCCVNGICKTPEQSCEARLGCEFYKECNENETDCKIAGWVIVVGAFVGILILMRFAGG